MNKFFYTLKIFIGVLFFQSTCVVNAQWTTDLSLNTPISVQPYGQKDPRIMKDGNGGAYIAWRDNRTGVPDIYVQRINSQGFILWAVNGVGACLDPADQSTPSIVKDMTGGCIVTWSDLRSGLERDIYAQRLDSNGNSLWATDGVIVANKSEREHNERIISDGNSGCIISWEQQDATTLKWDIWAQRLDSNGVFQWSNGGIPLSTNTSNKRNPKLQSDQYGGGYITWQDLRNGTDYDIYAQHVDLNGNLLWGNDALPVCTAIDDQNNPKIDPDDLSGGVYIAWADERIPSNGHDLYCQRIDSAGNFLWPVDGVAICATTGSQTAVDLLSNSEIDGVIATWKDSRSGDTDIYAQRINAAGVVAWQANGMPICTKPLAQKNPNISYDENGGALIVWEEETVANLADINAQRIDAAGTFYWIPNGVPVCNNSARQRGPKSVSDKTGGAIVVWQDYRSGSRDIYAQRIYSGGDIAVSVEEENNNSFSNISVYPNPFSDQFTIKFSLPKKLGVTISLVSIDGKEVFKKSVNTNQKNVTDKYEIQTDNISKGIYFLTLSSELENVTSKLIKY